MGKIDFLKWEKLILEGARLLDIEVTSRQAELFALHATELLLWNRKINLTTVTDPFEMAVKHFLDSIAAVPLIPSGITFLDIGSGGGFPGFPLKLMIPSNSAFLMDASRKKVSFLQHLIRLMKLTDITACHGRAEDLSSNTEFKNHFDMIVCRALTDLQTFVQMASPLLTSGGFLLAYKAHLSETEIKQVKMAGNKSLASEIDWTVSTKTYHLPFMDHPRTLVIMKPSPERFPNH